MEKVFLVVFVLFSFVSLSQTVDNEIIKVADQRELLSYNVLTYPNPSVGQIHIQAPEGAICRIVTSDGIYIGTWEIRESGLDLEELPSGNYVVQLKIENRIVVRRFLVL